MVSLLFGGSEMDNLTVLSCTYKEVYDKEYNYLEFSDRLEMQKMVFLMKELGSSCGSYSFMWYKYGPYSQELQNEILGLDCNITSKIQYTQNAQQSIKTIKGILKKNPGIYDLTKWIEAVASIHYLRRYIYSSFNDNYILDKIKEFKPYLNDDFSNKIAYNISLELLSGMG